MGGRKKKRSSSRSSTPAPAPAPAPVPIIKAGEVTGGEAYGGPLAGAKRTDKKKGTLADEQSVGVLTQALVEKLGQ